jgi:ankyrin repeat protein
MAKLLIEKGAEFSVQGSLRMTPLHWAALNGHKAVAKLLVEKGANLSEHGNHGNTPLLYAAKEGHEAIAKLLVEKGATSPCTTTTEVCHCIRLHFSLSL